MKEMQYDPLPLCNCESVAEPHYHQGGVPLTCYGDTLAGWKSLTDAECAAEYWRARADMCSTTPVFTSGAELQKFIQVWERFATHPHARESGYL
ncbi:hypothetical protein [Citricoccus sp. NR2]|uniref:hypothetical protein n=1 Tax=Citricoccus sp. NR2 TaxID=3004095 RepID=UPI0022DD19EB|nr:hypothetical protein [Citricoccus sp. NR2]WBL18486.1 hypothetical protein O1A05_12060 [Citricoccus sp. NR2]